MREPPRLQEVCRVVIRRNIRQQIKLHENVKDWMERKVDLLPLPKKINSFCCFKVSRLYRLLSFSAIRGDISHVINSLWCNSFGMPINLFTCHSLSVSLSQRNKAGLNSRPSVCPQKRFFSISTKFFYVDRCPWVLHEGIPYVPIQGQGHDQGGPKFA